MKTLLHADKSAICKSVSKELVKHFKELEEESYDVVYLPSLGYNLVRTGQLVDNGTDTLF